MQVVTSDSSAAERRRGRGPRSVGALCLVLSLCIVACARGETRGVRERPDPDARPKGDPLDSTVAAAGVPAGRLLTPSGSIEVDRPGTVITGRDVHGTIHVHADDVTIRDTRVTSSDYWPIWLDPGSRRLTVIHTEVVGSGSCQAGIGTHDYHATALDIRGCGDGAKAGSHTTIEDSWIHDLRVTPGSHNDGIQVSAGSHIVIRRNRIDGPVGQTSAVEIGPDYGVPVSDVVIIGNRLDGGAYALHLDARHAVVRDNRFGRASTVGPVDAPTPPEVWTHNLWADTGEPVRP